MLAGLVNEPKIPDTPWLSGHQTLSLEPSTMITTAFVAAT